MLALIVVVNSVMLISVRECDLYSIFSNICNLFSVIRVQGHDMYNVFSNISDLFSNIGIRQRDMYNNNLFSIIGMR